MEADNRNEETIFNAAIEIDSPQERAAFVKSACGDAAELLSRVEDLLKIHYHDKSFLKSPLVAAVTLDSSSSTEGPGETIGRYKLLQQIGEGGFGVVYMAEQRHPIQRKVALKIIKLGMDTKQVIARFEAERQALAMMDHPNIAKVFDAGATETGRPYFVMELVKGIPVTEYCDKNDLDTHQRLELFMNICRAVQHAHHKGIIHRDIKPSNILITLRDDDSPVPKVIDFGIAKATQARLTEKTLFTEFKQFVGTPEYMSPEQARMGEMGVDTRSDIYSLGVLLYELLTGTTPFDSQTLRNAGYNEIQRIISEDQPPKPSTRLSTLGDSLGAIAKHRKMAPSQLRREIQGELDWIVLKALEKDRTRRYGSADDLAQDIQRHLTHQPVAAGPPSKLYQMKKFAERHRIEVATAAVIAATVVIGLVVSTIMYFQAESAREKESIAREQADKSRLVAEAAREKEETARIEALSARDQAQQAKKVADEQRFQVQRLLTKSQFKRSIQLQNEGNVQGMLGLLEAWETAEDDPELRKSIGRLWAIAHDLSSERLVHFIPGNPVFSISPDGEFLVTFGGQTAQLWEMGTWQTHGPSLHLEKDIGAITFSPDGSLLATHSAEGASRLWYTSTGQPVGSILQHTVGEQKIINSKSSYIDANRLIAFSPDGKLLATGYPDGTVLFWDTSTGQSYGEVIEHDGLRAIAFSPDSKLIATGSLSPLIGAQLWEVATGQHYGPPLKTGQAVEHTLFSPDGKFLVTKEGTTHSIYIWDTKKGQLHKKLQHNRWMNDVEISPDGKHLAGGARDWVAPIWDISTGKLIGKTTPHRRGVDNVAFSLDSKLLATHSGSDGTMQLWDIVAGARYGSELHSPWGDRLVFSPDNKFLISSGNRIWKTYQQLRTERVPYQVGAKYGAVSPDGKTGAIILKNSVQLWDTSAEKALGKPLIHEDKITKVTFSPDGELLACSYGGFYPTIPGTQSGHYGTGHIRLWEVPTGRQFGPILETGYVFSLIFSPNGKLLASGRIASKADVFDVFSGQRVHAFNCEGDVYGVAFSPDSKILAAGLSEGMVEFWGMTSGQQIGPPLILPSGVLSVAFSPDGNLLATVSGTEKQTVRIWDIGSDPPYQNLALPPLAIRGKEVLKSFRGKGLILVNRCGEGTAQAWRLPKAPTNLREMKLKTWIALGAQRDQQGEVISVQSDQWQSLRQELARIIQAGNPQLIDVAASRGLSDIKLVWTPGSDASIHNIYFGTNPDKLELLGQVKETAFANFPTLDRDTQYGLRVDTVRSDGAVVKGDLWLLQTSKMVGLWKFDEIEGSKAADSSGDGLHGEFVGDARIVADPERGNVLSLDGDGDYVDCGDSWLFDMTKSVTITAWIKVDEFHKPWNSLIAKGDFSWRMMRNGETDNIEFACTGLSNNEWGYIAGSTNVNDSRWHHIAGVYDENSISLFIDGRLDFSEETTGPILTDNNPVHIGSHPEFQGLREWSGWVDDVRVYNYALSGGEVAAITAGQNPVRPDKSEWFIGVSREAYAPPDSRMNEDDAYYIPLESSHDPNEQRQRVLEALNIACNVLRDSEDPEVAYYWQYRGSIYAVLKQWNMVISDYSRVVELDPNRVNMFYLRTLAHLGLDDAGGYRLSCEELQERFGKTQNPDQAHWTAWTCVLAPDAVENFNPVIELAELAVEKGRETDQNNSTLGAILYRAGRFEEAVEKLTELSNAWEKAGQFPTRNSPAYTWFFLAMAHQQQGDIDEAKAWFGKAVQRSEEELRESPAWNRELTLQLLQGEAAQLLGVPQ